MAVFNEQSQLARQHETTVDNSALKFSKGVRGVAQKSAAWMAGYDPRTGRKMTSGVGKFASGWVSSLNPVGSRVSDQYLQNQMKQTGGGQFGKEEKKTHRKQAFKSANIVGSALLKAFGINVDGEEIAKKIGVDGDTVEVNPDSPEGTTTGVDENGNEVSVAPKDDSVIDEYGNSVGGAQDDGGYNQEFKTVERETVGSMDREKPVLRNGGKIRFMGGGKFSYSKGGKFMYAEGDKIKKVEPTKSSSLLEVPVADADVDDVEVADADVVSAPVETSEEVLDVNRITAGISEIETGAEEKPYKTVNTWVKNPEYKPSQKGVKRTALEKRKSIKLKEWKENFEGKEGYNEPTPTFASGKYQFVPFWHQKSKLNKKGEKEALDYSHAENRPAIKRFAIKQGYDEFKGISDKFVMRKFLKNPKLQEEYMQSLIVGQYQNDMNKSWAKPIVEKYGKNDTIALLHFAGSGNVKKHARDLKKDSNALFKTPGTGVNVEVSKYLEVYNKGQEKFDKNQNEVIQKNQGRFQFTERLDDDGNIINVPMGFDEETGMGNTSFKNPIVIKGKKGMKIKYFNGGKVNKYFSGGVTKGKFSHEENPLAVVDKDGNHTGMELTGEEGVFDKKAMNKIESLSSKGKFGALGKFVKAEMETWDNTSNKADGGLDLGKSVGYLESVNGFENAGKGSLAIGYDSKGGTSYGTIQIASKTGAMKQFKKYLEVLSNDGDENAKAILKEINTISDAKWNTGSKKGDAVTLWNKIAETYNADDVDGNKLVDFERGFADKKYTQPVLDWYTKKYSIDEAEVSDSVKAMIASRSIQHGVNGSQRVIKNALGDDVSDLNEDEIISSVYDEVRDNVDKYFKNSTADVQASVKQRMIDEKKVVLKDVTISGSRVLPANATEEQKALFNKTQREEQFSSPARIKIDAAIKKYKKEQEKYRVENKEYIDVDVDARELKNAIADENILVGYDDIESMQAEYNKLNDRKIELYGKAASEKNEDSKSMKKELFSAFKEYKIELDGERNNTENPMSIDVYTKEINQINEYTSRLNTHLESSEENLKIYTDYVAKEAEFTLSDEEMAEMDAKYLANPTLGVTGESKDDLMKRLQKDKDKQESLLRNMLGEDDEGNPRDIDALLEAAEEGYEDGTVSSGELRLLRDQKRQADALKERVDVTTKTLSQQEYLYAKDEAYQNQKNVTEDGKSIDYSVPFFTLDYNSEYGLNYTTEEKEENDELLAQYKAEQEDDAKYDFLDDDDPLEDASATDKEGAPVKLMSTEELSRYRKENFDTAKKTGIAGAIAKLGGVDGALSLIGMAAGYKAATAAVPQQKKSQEWIEQMQRTKDRMNLGLDANTKTMYQRNAERTYAYDAANIGRGATSGQSALGALGAASSRKYNADLQLASMDATAKEQHFGQYQSALVRDEGMTQDIWKRNQYDEASRRRDLKAGLIGQAVKNVRDNTMYEKSYGDGSMYAKLMRSKLLETKETTQSTQDAKLLAIGYTNEDLVNADAYEAEPEFDFNERIDGKKSIADRIEQLTSKFK